MFDVKEYNQKYYQENKERISAKARLWSQNNPDRKAINWKRYYTKHKQQILDQQKESANKLGKYKVIWFNGRCVYEHRHVMSQFLGRELLRTEFVHHIDGNRANNKIDNLELFSSIKEHRQKHKQ